MTTVGPLVLIIEDEPQMVRFLRASLATHNYRLIESITAADGLAHAAARNPDLILLDLGLPDLDGLEVTRRIREWTGTPIIVLSARGQDEDKISALDAGADDYLTKPFAVAELLARVRAMARRKISGRVLRYAGVELDRHQRSVTRAGRTIALTSREFALLEFLLSRAPNAVPRHEIIEQVWDESYEHRSNVVDAYVRLLRNKIDRPFGAASLETVRGAGYRLRGDA